MRDIRWKGGGKEKMRRKEVSQKEYDQIKMFLETGAKMTKIAKVLDRSVGTLLRIKRAKDWTEYVNDKNAFAAKLRAKKNGATAMGTTAQTATGMNLGGRTIFGFTYAKRSDDAYIELQKHNIVEAVNNIISVLRK